jgi:hypothetical protein
MKLKFELVNGYGVLVDEEEEIIAGDLILWNGKVKTAIDTEYIHPNHKIIFAEKELNLEGVPIFEWREFALSLEIIPKATEFVKTKVKMSSQAPGVLIGFVEGYKSNPAKYTEEDLINIFILGGKHKVQNPDKFLDKMKEIIQSLQKYPKYVVMEREEKTVEEIQKELGIYGHDEGLSEREFEEYKKSKSIYKYKLFTNSEGKQQGTIKELIWT